MLSERVRQAKATCPDHRLAAGGLGNESVGHIIADRLNGAVSDRSMLQFLPVRHIPHAEG